MDRQWISWAQQARRPVAITGAGISVPSGLPTVSKTWRGFTLKEIFTVDFYRRDPLTFYDCYRDMLLDWRVARPNPAHLALAEAGVPVITQNLDGLHQKAGSRDVLELHGNLRELLCERCGALYPAHAAEANPQPLCPTCGVLLKPNIVLEGEDVRHIAVAADRVGQADLLLVIGTKLAMKPVCTLPQIAAASGIPILHCNKKAEELLPALCVYLRAEEA
ncbi:NAD-dependent deacetylase [Tumebacillus sp. BK434]|uniref:SIR2 family NAD-dependent protein deacylase n=1 Tax=Tumebacillus sp. BK434 TaxID=2512169 RepID=UPI00104B2D22|nr:Sir2 family NAD-dependent protein deacetylase [Tumebacillus sp. BK434]TCP59494.1 NAD-dependent deacetylase [Tumebacillus sp. BK434]